jgi:cobalt-zinc-cadmium efflux system outer membrane protein
VQGLGIPDIDVSASLDQQPHLLQLGHAGEKNVGLGIVVPFADKFRLRNSIGVSEIRSAEYSYTQVRQVIAAQTAQQYDSLLVAIRHRSDLLASRELSADFLKRTNARFEAGTAARLDVIRAQVDVAQADNQLIANERAIANAQAGLNRFLNRPLGEPIVPVDSLSVPPFLPSIERVEGYALSHRPELGVMSNQIAGARATTRLAQEFWVPDFTVGAARDYAQSGPATFSAGLVFPFPIVPWAHTRGEIAQDAFRERELKAALVDLRAQIGQDVRNAYAAASTSLRQAIYIRDQLLPAARAAYKAASASYVLGGSSALEVIDARRTLLDAESQYTDALTAASTARWDLERAAGTSLDTFGPGAAP